jgi:hypothetical protein
MNGPSKFTKKPVTIEAWQFVLGLERDEDGETQTSGNALEIAEWCDGLPMGKLNADGTSDYWIEIATLEGTHKATPGDFIIKGVQGEFYPCKPDIFDATYEAASE